MGIPATELDPEIRQSSIEYAGLMGRWDKQLINQVSDVPSIISFFIISCEILCKNRFNLCIFLFFHNLTKTKNKEF